MENLGMTHTEICEALGRGDRYIREVKAYGKADGTALVVMHPDPVSRENLAPDIAALLEWTVDAFAAFFERFFGKPLPDHCRPWIEAFLVERNLILNVPPRHAKSTVFSVWIPIWLLCRDRNVQILLVSKTKVLSETWARDIAFQLEHNQDLVACFGRFTPERSGDFPWRPNRGELMVGGRTRESKGAQLSIQSRGRGQQIFGMEADYVIVDDPVDSEVAASPTENKKFMEWIREQVFSRLNPGGVACVIGQRVHRKDLYGELGKQVHERGPKKGLPLWAVQKSPAVLKWPDDNDGVSEVLWQDVWPYEELMVSYERVGGFAPFECMYQQNPLPEGAALVLEEWVEGCRNRDMMAGRGWRVPEGEDEFLPVVRVLSVDPSPGRYHGLVVGDVIYSRDQFYFCLVDVRRFIGGMRDLMSTVLDLLDMYRPEYFIFEESTFSKWFYEAPEYQKVKDLVQLISHKTNVNKKDEQMGIESLAGDFEFARIMLPWGDADARAMSGMLTEEALSYPQGDTDDVLLALWFIKWNYKRLIPRKGFTSKFRGTGTGNEWGYMREAKEQKNQSQITKWRLQMRRKRAS